MTNKVIYIVGGLIFWFFALIGLRFDIDSYNVQKHGKLISVKVTYVPNCFGTKVKQHFRFQYIDNGVNKEYSKQIGGGLCGKLVVGQDLKLKADLEKKIFLYENEDVRNEFYASGLFGLAGLISLIFGLKKQKHTTNSHNTF
ncbi:MAG TPA: hypothetical protein VMV56_01045 [Williamwhitmania sp.]|nr:hypothetical protein [Williamwhitmania sp.]